MSPIIIRDDAHEYMANGEYRTRNVEVTASEAKNPEHRRVREIADFGLQEQLPIADFGLRIPKEIID